MASTLAGVVFGASLAAAATIAGGGVHGAEAQPQPAPSATDRAEAGKLVEEANLAFDAKDYERSIELNQKANALVPHPIFLFIMAQAHRLAGRTAQAAALYEQYLAQAPNGEQAAAARVWLSESKAAQAAVDAVAAAPVAAAPAASISEPDVAQATPPMTVNRAAPAIPERTDPVAQPGRSLRITGLVLGGVGIVSVAYGLYNGRRVTSLDNDAENELAMGVPREIVRAKYEDDAQAAERRQDIGYLIGGALIVGGAVTYWLGHRKDTAAQTTAWAPVVGPGYTGLAVSGAL